MVVQFDPAVTKREDKKAMLTIAFPKSGLQIGRLVAKDDPSSSPIKDVPSFWLKGGKPPLLSLQKAMVMKQRVKPP